MADNIVRISTVTTRVLTIGNSVTADRVFSMAGKAGALIHVVSTSTAGNVIANFHSMLNEGISPSYPVRDSTNTAIALTLTPGQCYALPDELFAAMRVCPVLTTNVTADIVVTFKT